MEVYKLWLKKLLATSNCSFLQEKQPRSPLLVLRWVHTAWQVPVRQLSGGEQRRLSLLRALSIHPQFLVLDEVTSGLDLLSADAVLQVLERYHEEFGCAYLLITHDRQTAYRISSRILELNQGVFVREAVRTEST